MYLFEWVFIGIVCAVLIGAGVGGYALASWSCSSRAETMGIKHTFGLAQGCMVEWKGQWVPLSAVRAL